MYQNREYPMERSSEAFKLVTRIQDETHRFAIDYHRRLHGKGQLHSKLDEIDGIGPKRKMALIRHFKSMEKIREATVEELCEVPEMNRKAAEHVRDFFDTVQE